MKRYWWLAIALFACKEEPAAVEPAAVEPADLAVEVEPISARANTHPVRDLTKEAPRLELRAGGLMIDVGGADQHKYLDPFAAEDELHFSFSDWMRFDRVVMRARAAKKKKSVTLSLDGASIGRRTIGTDWKITELVMKRPATAGFHTLSIDPGEGIEVDWMWLGTADRAPPLETAKVETVSFGAPRHALLADPPRTLSFYFEIEEESRFVFDYGADGPASFSVYVTEDGEGRQRVFSNEASPGAWKEGVIDLSELAGKVVRLDLVTRGEAARAAWGEPHVVRPGARERPPLLGKDRPRNVVFVVIDTVRQDVFSAFNPKTKVKTPAFSALAKESTIFRSAYAPAPWTKPSVASILSGLYPSTHGALTEEAILPEDVPLLSEHLKARGYTTGLFSANGYVSDRFGFERGWDRYVNFPRERKKTQAEFVYRDVLEWIRERKPNEPFFAYVQTVDPHVPYQAPSKHLDPYYDRNYDGTLGAAVSGYEHDDFNDGKLQLDDEDRAYLIGQYYGEISYHDEHFGEFIEALRELDLLDDTLLVVSNDHGEELFERGKLGHGQSLYEELIRSPLLIRAPGIFPAGLAVDEPVSLVDVPPTVLQVLGKELMEMEGASLIDVVQGRPALVPSYAISERRDLERSIRLGRYKLISTRDAPDQLYDLGADPEEKSDLTSSHPIVRRTLQMHLFEGLAVPKKVERLAGVKKRRRHKAQDAVIDPELMEELKALGYFND